MPELLVTGVSWAEMDYKVSIFNNGIAQYIGIIAAIRGVAPKVPSMY